MKQLNKLVLILFLSGASAHAQDIITLRNGNEIRARVMEVSSSEIRYKRFDNLEGATIVVSVMDVFFINYENGQREIFNNQTDQPAQAQTPAQAMQQAQQTTVVQEPLRNPVSNIRVQQIGNMLHVMYDLEVLSNIEVRISLDNGATYRSRSMQRASGAIGRNIHPGSDRLLIWDIVRELANIDYSGIVIRIVANGVVIAENIAETDIIIGAYKYYDRFYAGVVAGQNIESGDFAIGLNAAYFFNHRIGAGFAVRSFKDYGHRNDKGGITFIGPVFYGHLLQTRNGKIIFPTRIGLGIINSSYIDFDEKDTDFGFFISGGFAYRPSNRISLGFDIEYFNRKTQDFYFDTGYVFTPRMNALLINFGLNFHF